jgi:phenylacetate-CoA ligase
MTIAAAFTRASQAPWLAWEYLSLLQSQWYNSDRLREIQRARLREVLDSAKRIRFFRERLQSDSCDPDEIADVIQPVRKLEVRATPLETRLAAGTRQSSLIRVLTSGSTAQPFEVVMSPAEKNFRVVGDLRAMQANGLRPRDLFLSFRYLKHVAPDGFDSSFFGFFPRKHQACDISAQERLDWIHSLRPQFVLARPSSLIPMAKLLAGSAAAPNGVKRLVSFAEFLDAQSRAFIESAFGVRIMNHYGMFEVAFIAWQCPSSSVLHINAETHLVEAVDDGGRPVPEGEVGELLVTSLVQKTHPFLRYRTGDRGSIVRTRCCCGRELPSLTLTRGRTTDRLYNARGEESSPAYVDAFWIEGIIHYQLVQESYTLFLLRYVRAPGADADKIEDEITKRFRNDLGAGTTLVFERMDVLPMGAGGKVKTFISKIDAPDT